MTWQSPLATGGSAITSYTARAWTGASNGSIEGSCQPSPLTGFSCTIAGLTNATTYYVDVIATNAIGSGAEPDARIPVTPAAPAGGGGGGGSSGGSGSTGGGGGGGSATEVTEVRPSSGPASGGARILVLGFGFWGATGVTIGGVPASDFRFLDAATLEVTTPPGTAGWQDLAVIMPGGKISASYLYVAAAPSAAGSGTGTTPASPPAVPAAAPAPAFVGPAGSPIVRPTTVSAGQTAVTSVGRAAGTIRRAPIVTGALGDAFKLRVIGLPKSSRATAQIRIGGRYYSLGKVATTARGSAVLPAFSAQRAGTYLVKVKPAGGAARYIRVVVR